MKTFDQEIDAIDGSKIIKHGNDAPAWMTTYADLMSLLFALFVLLLSFSEVNDESFQQNAGPMREAFSENSDFQTDQQSYKSGGLGILSGVKSVPMNVPEGETIREAMLEELRRSLFSDLSNNLVQLEETPNGALLRFPSQTAFASGGAELLPDAYGALDKIASVLSRTPGDIKVGGHTDNVPISTLQFRSNWDLSAARATSVVHYFLRSGQIPKQRLTSQGYADSRPLVPNKNAVNQKINRRVEILIEIPNNTEDAQKFLKNAPPKRRIWTINPGEKEITPQTEAIDPVERDRLLREKQKKPEKEKGVIFKQDLSSIGR